MQRKEIKEEGLKKARELEIPILSEEDFLHMAEEQ